MKVLAYGELLWDIIEDKAYIGGAPFNFLAHMAQCGAEAYMISRLGKDELGKSAFEKVQGLQVHTDFIQWDTIYPTGTVDVILQDGHPDYTINPNVAYDQINFPELEQAGLMNHNFDIFAFGTLVQRHPVSRASLYQLFERCTFQHVFYDVNLRKGCYDESSIKASLSHSTILKLNHEEILVLGKMLYQRKMMPTQFCQQIQQDFPQDLIIITAAEEGCLIFSEGKLEKVPGKKVQLVDAVGAGDSFSAAFLTVYFRAGDPIKAAEIANQMGAFVAANRGPIPRYSPEIKTILGIH